MRIVVGIVISIILCIGIVLSCNNSNEKRDKLNLIKNQANREKVIEKEKITESKFEERNTASNQTEENKSNVETYLNICTFVLKQPVYNQKNDEIEKIARAIMDSGYIDSISVSDKDREIVNINGGNNVNIYKIIRDDQEVGSLKAGYYQRSLNEDRKYFENILEIISYSVSEAINNYDFTDISNTGDLLVSNLNKIKTLKIKDKEGNLFYEKNNINQSKNQDVINKELIKDGNFLGSIELYFNR